MLNYRGTEGRGFVMAMFDGSGREVGYGELEYCVALLVYIEEGRLAKREVTVYLPEPLVRKGATVH